MVTLWNDMRLASGLPVLGFLNPMLYAVAKLTPEAYNDITTGNNACGVGRSLETAPCCDHAFASAPGWDATSGLGTVNYGIFARLVINNATFFPALAAYSSMPPSTSSGSDMDNTYITRLPDEYHTLLTLSMLALCLSVVSIVLWFCQVFKLWKKIEYTGINDSEPMISKFQSYSSSSHHSRNEPFGTSYGSNSNNTYQQVQTSDDLNHK